MTTTVNLKDMPEKERKMVLLNGRITIFYLMCDLLGEDATPAQIARLTEKAKVMFEPQFYEYPVRAAKTIGITLNLNDPE